MLLPGISVCIIAKNEEQMLLQCIESVKDVALEIIVGDTGSSDSTPSIARNAGCTLLSLPWNNDFSEARNSTISVARGEFILVIDADERLLNPEELENTTNNISVNTGGILVEVISKAERERGAIDIYSAKLLRLFRNNPSIRFSGKIHEQVGASIVNAGFGISSSSIKFDHLGYNLSLDKMKEKQERNLHLLDESLSQNPEQPYLLYQRGRTHLAFNNLDKAAKDFEKALLLTEESNAQYSQILNYYSITKFKSRELNSASELAEKSLSIMPVQSFANYILGEINLEGKQFAEAYQHFRAMQEAITNKNIMSQIAGDYSLPEEQLKYRMGKCLMGLNMLKESVLEFEAGIKANPSDTGCLVGLANVAYKINKYEESLAILKKALSIEPKSKDIHNFIAQVESAISKVKEKQNGANNPQQSVKPLLSLSMIVKNEGKYLRGCLESAKNIVDEIIIVDTGSTDDTVSIAKEFGAKIYHFNWCNDFAAARNESLKHCTGEWVFYIDADERISQKIPLDIRNALATAHPNIGGFVCTIESGHAQLDGSTEMHRGGYPRIFRNLGYPVISFRGRVHEQISPSILENNLGFIFSDIIIEHLGYNQSREIMEQKIKRNYAMLIQHVQEEPTNGYAWYQLGQTLGQMKLSDNAEETIKFAIKCGDLSPTIYASASATLAQLSGNAKRFEEALQWAEESLLNAPNQIYARNLKAYSLYHLNRPAEAEVVFISIKEMISQKRGVPQTGFDIEIPVNVVDSGLEKVRKMLGKN